MSGKRKQADDAEIKRQQASAVKRAKKQAGSLEVGKTHYIIPTDWFKKWTAYATESPVDAPPPGAIDNSQILDPLSPKGEPQLRLQLSEHEDYEIISENEWKLFSEWYGGGPIIKRGVIAEGENQTAKRVEVYLMDIIVMPCKKDGSPDEASGRKIYLSKMSKLQDLLLKASMLYEYRPTAARLWNYEDPDRASIISDLDRTLVDEQLVYGQIVLIEKQQKLGVWPRDSIAGKSAAKKKKPGWLSRIFGLNGTADGATTPNGSKTSSSEDPKEQLPLGLCGLRNLGNTCFMNSALQCLSNTEPLRNYFVSGNFRNDINKSNPLGMKGQVAEQFGNLLKEMWGGTDASIAPKSFKHTIGKFAPQFEGFNQHDAHELLSFVLDGLHEDLNRVQKKPYVEKKEGNGRPDPEVALEAWEGHLKRNQSVVVDLFHGLLKSTVTCPECSKVSVTFDPFMNLSLPLLQETERPVEIIFLRQNERKTPYKYAPRVSKHGKVSDVRDALATAVQVPANNIILAYIEDFRINYIYDDNDPTTKIDQSEFLVGYEVPEGNQYVHLRGLHRRRRRKRSVAAFGPTYETFGIPFLFSIIPGETTGLELYRYAWMRCQRFITLPSLDDNNEGAESEASSDEEDDEDETPAPTKSKKSKKNAASALPPGPVWDIDAMPFRLCLTIGSGNHCARCGNACDGCYFEPTDDPISLPKDVKLSIALDWEDYVLEHHFDDDEALSVRLNKSVSESRKEYSQKTEMTLDDCLKLFTTTERLGSNDLWYCPECKEHRRAWKKFDIWSLPDVLVIHLKRFQFNRNLRTKLSVDVDFPLYGLNLDPYVINPDAKGEVYDLYGVSNHMGGLGGGHYTAYCWNLHASRWFGFNDSMVTPVRDPNSVKTNTAYLLFYKKRPRGQKEPVTPINVPPSAQQDDPVSSDEDEQSEDKPKKTESKDKDAEGDKKKPASSNKPATSNEDNPKSPDTTADDPKPSQSKEDEKSKKRRQNESEDSKPSSPVDSTQSSSKKSKHGKQESRSSKASSKDGEEDSKGSKASSQTTASSTKRSKDEEKKSSGKPATPASDSESASN